MVINFKRKSIDLIKDGGNSDMFKITNGFTPKRRETQAVGGGGGVFMAGIIQFPDDFDETEKDYESSKKSVSNEDLDEDLDIKQARVRTKRQL
jgi:hypothetical protein